MPVSNDDVIGLFNRGLDAASLRQDTTAHNLANLNTPNFSRSHVSFEDNLRQAMEQEERPSIRATHPQHFGVPGPEQVEPRVEVDDQSVKRIDGNNVDMEKEMTNMVKNQLKYNAMSDQTTQRIRSWEYVINEGR